MLCAPVLVAAAACSLTTSLDGFTNGPVEAPRDGGASGDTATDAVVGEGGGSATDADAAGNDAASPSPYAAAVLADNPLLYYRLGETDVTKPAVDSSKSARPAAFRGSVVCGVPGAIANDPDTACRFDGTTTAVFVEGGPTFAGSPPPPYSLEAWAHPTHAAGPIGHVVAGVEQEPNDGYAIFFYDNMSPRFERETPMGTDGIVAPAGRSTRSPSTITC